MITGVKRSNIFKSYNGQTFLKFNKTYTYIRGLSRRLKIGRSIIKSALKK